MVLKHTSRTIVVFSEDLPLLDNFARLRELRETLLAVRSTLNVFPRMSVFSAVPVRLRVGPIRPSATGPGPYEFTVRPARGIAFKTAVAVVTAALDTLRKNV